MAAPVVTFYSPAGNGKVKNNDTVGTWIAASGSLSLSTSSVTYIENAGSLSEKNSAGTKEGYNVTAADLTGEPWNFSSGGADDGEHIVVWLYAYEGWDSLTNGGFRIIIADDKATDSVGWWYVGPQDGYIGGWYPYIISPKKQFNSVTAGTAPVWTTSGNPAQLTGVDGIGGGWKITSTISGATDNCYIDAMIIGQGYQITNGDAGSTEGKFSDFITWEETATNRYGFLRSVSSIPFFRGKVIIGATSGATNTEFIDSGFTVVWEKVTLSDGASSAVDSGFYELRAAKGSGTTDITLSQGVFKAASPHTVVVNLSAATSATLTGVNLDRGDAVTLGSTVIWTDSVFTNCGQITASGSTFTGNSVSGYTGSADTAALLWNDAGDPDANIDNCTFTKTTGTAHHAIELGVSSPSTVTLRGITFSGFNGSDAQNDSVLLLDDKGSNTAWTIYTVSCDGTVSYKKARSGDTVTIVADPVTVLVNIKNASGTNIENARVLVKASDNTGPFPFEESVTISNSGTTATVTHTTHGMATNDKVVISGASQEANNGIFTITVTGVSTYTYTMGSSPSSPTGTIISTYVALSGLTDASGNISMSRVFSADQPVVGWARKSSSSPYYKTGPIGGSIDSATGFTANVQLISDE